MAERESGRTGLTDSQVSSFYYGKGLAFIREQPGPFIKLTLRKIMLFLNGYEIPSNIDFYFFRDIAWPLKMAFVPFGLLMPLGLLGMALSAGAWRKHLLYYLFFLTYSASLIIFFILARYRIPIAPVLIIYGRVRLAFRPGLFPPAPKSWPACWPFWPRSSWWSISTSTGWAFASIKA